VEWLPNRSPHTTLAHGPFQSGAQIAVGGAGLTRVVPFHDEATLTYMPGELVTGRASPPAPDPATQRTAIASRAHRELVAHERPGEHRPPPCHPGRCAVRLLLAVDNFIGEGMPGHSKLLASKTQQPQAHVPRLAIFSVSHQTSPASCNPKLGRRRFSAGRLGGALGPSQAVVPGSGQPDASTALDPKHGRSLERRRA